MTAIRSSRSHPKPAPRRPQEVREAFLAQDALKAVVTLVAEPLSNHPEMSERVRSDLQKHRMCRMASTLQRTESPHRPPPYTAGRVLH
jgi:hypothetical protein